jgi:hypothetical protein
MGKSGHPVGNPSFSRHGKQCPDPSAKQMREMAEAVVGWFRAREAADKVDVVDAVDAVNTRRS